MFRKKYKELILKRISEFVKLNYQKIDGYKEIDEGEGMFNSKCQHNAVQKFYENKDDVYMCIIMNSKYYPVVHFINKNKDNKFVDNTLGYQSNFYDYYIIRRVDKCEFTDMDKLLCNMKDKLIEINSNRFLRKILRIKRDII